MKPCEICGQEIPWAKTDYPKYYATKRFCSKSCQNEGLRRRVDYSGNLKCSHCKEFKPSIDFYPDRNTSRGFGYICRTCQVLIRKPDKRDPATERERLRAYRLSNLEKVRQKDRAYIQKNKRAIEARRQAWHAAMPGVQKAHAAVYHAIRRGELSHISMQECARCHGQAEQYHHPSYHPNDRLNVIPLCVSCHRLTHTRPEVTAEIECGVVLTSVGMVRIAIAYPK